MNGTQEFLFKQDYVGVGKKDGKPFRFIELHDPKTLENTRFFIEPDSTLSTQGFILKDKVKAGFAMEIKFGRPATVLTQLLKAN